MLNIDWYCGMSEGGAAIQRKRPGRPLTFACRRWVRLDKTHIAHSTSALIADTRADMDLQRSGPTADSCTATIVLPWQRSGTPDHHGTNPLPTPLAAKRFRSPATARHRRCLASGFATSRAAEFQSGLNCLIDDHQNRQLQLATDAATSYTSQNSGISTKTLPIFRSAPI